MGDRPSAAKASCGYSDGGRPEAHRVIRPPPPIFYKVPFPPIRRVFCYLSPGHRPLAPSGGIPAHCCALRPEIPPCPASIRQVVKRIIGSIETCFYFRGSCYAKQYIFASGHCLFQMLENRQMRLGHGHPDFLGAVA